MTTHGISPERLAGVNERIWEETLEEHKLFSEAFKAGQCYLCGDALTKFDQAKPCPHWLLTAFKGGAPMSTIAAAAQTADRIDYWIRRHVIPHCYGTHPSQSQSKFNPARDRRVWLSAIGQSLKDQYDALSPPMPPHLAVLVRQLETQK